MPIGTFVILLFVLSCQLAGAEPPPNLAPVADAGPDQTVIEGTSVTLDGTASTDPDNSPQPLTYQWTQLSGPTVTITDWWQQ